SARCVTYPASKPARNPASVRHTAAASCHRTNSKDPVSAATLEVEPVGPLPTRLLPPFQLGRKEPKQSPCSGAGVRSTAVLRCGCRFKDVWQSTARTAAEASPNQFEQSVRLGSATCGAHTTRP